MARRARAGSTALIRAGLADSTRLGIYGHSYGGYLTAWAITQTRRFDAAGVLAGAVDLAGLYGQSDIHTLSRLGVRRRAVGDSRELEAHRRR